MGYFFDALTLPMQTLSALTDEIDDTEIIFKIMLNRHYSIRHAGFPQCRVFANLPRTFVPSGM